MRYAHTLVLLVMAALSIAALIAPQALAQEPLQHNQSPDLQARVEPGGTLCPVVTPTPVPTTPPVNTSGGCRIHARGLNILLEAHIFGFETVDSTCDTEFDARLDSSAEGYLTHAELTQGTQGTCTRRPCGTTSPGVEGRPWSAYGRENGAEFETITVLFCLWGIDNQTNTHCEVSIPFAEFEGGVPTNHRYQIVAFDQECHGVAGFRGELTGVWNTEMVTGTNGESQTEQQVEINHL